MKKNTLIFIASSLLISSFMSSCVNATDNNSKEQTEEVSHEEHNHDEENETLELNNGEKWKVDAPMLIHIRTMENDIISFPKEDPKNYAVLSKKLLVNIDSLTSNCTMKGKAHDELHKWLLPYIDMVKELSEAKNETEASEQFKNIQTSFSTFNQYFQ